MTLGVLRLDRLHPLWGGNKVFKLLPNLRRAEALGQRRVISFGGAYSNHLHALAAWGREHGLETVGIVRGEAPAVSVFYNTQWLLAASLVARDAHAAVLTASAGAELGAELLGRLKLGRAESLAIVPTQPGRERANTRPASAAT